MDMVRALENAVNKADAAIESLDRLRTTGCAPTRGSRAGSSVVKGWGTDYAGRSTSPIMTCTVRSMLSRFPRTTLILPHTTSPTSRGRKRISKRDTAL